MSGVPLNFVRNSVGPYLFEGLPEELSNLVTSEVNYHALFCLIYRDEHAIWLIHSFDPLYQLHRAAHGANFGLITLCHEGNRLAVLAFLYTPSNLDKTGLLEGVFIQILDGVLLLIVEDEIVGDESLDDRFTKWLGMMIDFILSGLGVFA